MSYKEIKIEPCLYCGKTTHVIFKQENWEYGPHIGYRKVRHYWCTACHSGFSYIIK